MPYPGWFEQHKNNIEQWWGDGIRTNPKRPPSPGSGSYYRRPQTSQREALDRVVNKVETVFQNYDTDSSALLSPSISSKPYSPVRLITNKLYSVKKVEQSWFIDDSRRADDPVSDAVRRNKRIASSVHKFKGRESDAIVFVGSNSFAEHVEKVDPRNVFNMFYVGATRARKQLLIVQWSEQAHATHTSRVKYVEDEDFVPAPCPVTKALEYSPYIKMLCEESPACIEAKTTETIAAVSLGRQDHLVSGAHTPQRLMRLQLLLDDGKLEVPPEWDGDEEMPLDLQVFFTHLRSQAEKARSYSWASVPEIATAFLTKRDRMYYRWRQVRYFARWQIVMNSVKLNEVVRNLVMLLEVVCGGKGAEAMKGVDDVEATLVYAEVLTRLKRLRNDMRILFHDAFQFDMGCNPGFVQRCAPSLIGEPDFIVLSKEEADLDAEMESEERKER
ncbi:UvrD-like helicase [Gracilaria domingensis]|nr:UvrD-like helicase [Gracilaria domingensis]